MDIISAFAEGKTIQYKTDTGSWHDLTENEGLPMGTLAEEPNKFRIKPEPKYRPFANAEECWTEMQKHQPFGWLKDSEGCYLHIVSMEIKFIGAVNSSGNIISQFYSGFYCDYTFADGTPFGVKLEEK